MKVLGILKYIIFSVVAVTCCAGCATYDKFHARFREQDYLVTRAFYQEAPQRVAVLPFASRKQEEKDRERAAACRKVYYQHFSLQDFEDVEMGKLDRRLLRQKDPEKPHLGQHVISFIGALDVVGMSSLMDIHAVFKDEDSIEYSAFVDAIRMAEEELEADAYVAGIMRSYGRVYVVAASSIGISTRVELRSSKTGALLWRGEGRDRNLQLPISLNPIDIPYLLYYTWQNSRGVAMDMMAYAVYRDMTKNIPYVARPRDVFVKTRDGAPYFRKPTMWRVFSRGHLPADTLLEFRLEKRGWYQCHKPGEKNPIWIFRRDAELVDAEGLPVDDASDIL